MTHYKMTVTFISDSEEAAAMCVESLGGAFDERLTDWSASIDSIGETPTYKENEPVS
jgi:hypothetical protein